MFERFRADLRHGRRALARTPLITASAILCLATGIAAATAVFTVVDGIVLRPLPFAHGARLVSAWSVSPSRDTVRRGFSWPDAQDIGVQTHSLDGLAALSNAPAGMTLTGRGDAIQIPSWIVSGNFFDVLGVRAALGRVLSNDDDRPGSAPVVIVSDALWRRRFGADPAIVGQMIALDGRAFAIAGVAPRSFAYPPKTDLWVTAAHGAPEVVMDRSVGWLMLIGLLKTGVTPEAAQAELTGPVDDLARRYHPSRGREMLSVIPLQRELLGDTRPALLALFAAVVILLAVACANVGGLLIVRSAARARDVAIRVAMGAERSDILRRAFAESLLIAGASGALGVTLSVAVVNAAKRFAPPDIPGLSSVSVDARVLAFAVAVVLIVTVACALSPVSKASTADVQSVLQQGGRGASGDRAMLRRVLASAEIALSILLLVGAGLVGRTFLNLRAVDVGFRADRVLAFDVPQPTTRYPAAADSVRFADRLLPRMTALPGVRGAAAVLLRPLWGPAGMDWPVVIEGQSPADALQNPLTNLEAVSANYFQTMEIPIVEGRPIDDSDGDGRPGAAVVSQSFARRFWPNEPALGRRLQFPLPGSPYHRQWFTVVGIVGDARYRELRAGRLDLYISAAHCPYPVHQFVVRTDGPPALLTAAIRAEVRAIDRDLPIDDVVVLGDAVSQQIANPRLTALIFLAFAVTATSLAAIGLATLISWQVRQRTREIGIRVALGARAGQVIRLVMADGALVVSAGVGVGLLLAAAAVTFLRSLLFEVAPHDPVTIAVSIAVAVVVGLLSTYIPARRSSRVDPLIALRAE